MSSTAALCPPYLTAADELSHPVGDDPLWSENYLSQAYFPAAESGLWLHQCRPALDRELWEEIAVIYLPGDRLLVAKGTGVSRSDDGPWGAALRYRCVEPFVTWVKDFRGTARLVTGDELRAGPLLDGLSVGGHLQTTWQALAPAFDWDVSEVSWADEHSHYEQHCAVSGTLRVGDQQLVLQGSGIRDHSWGPRDVSQIGRHIWAHAQFPGGRSFMLFDHVAPDDSHICHLVIDTGDGARAGELLSAAPLLDGDAARASEGYELRVRVDGDVHVLHAEVLQVAALGLAGMSELVLGAPQGAPASHQLFESQTRFTWDGETGYGLSERTVRLP